MKKRMNYFYVPSYLTGMGHGISGTGSQEAFLALHQRLSLVTLGVWFTRYLNGIFILRISISLNLPCIPMYIALYLERLIRAKNNLLGNIDYFVLLYYY